MTLTYKCQCKICGSEFSAATGNACYCSDKCRSQVYGRKAPNQKTCVVCKAQFGARNWNHKYCGTICSSRAQESRRSVSENSYPQQATCDNCLKSFTAKTASHRYCSSSCRKEYGQRKESVPETEDNALAVTSKTRGRYVYAWLDNGAVFYIGRGEGKRVVKKHISPTGQDAPCQEWRNRIGSRFSYRIIRDNLTDEGAMLVEAVLIDLLRPACNQVSGMTRREQPPLTLPRVLESLVA